jgi:hypothetical protein
MYIRAETEEMPIKSLKYQFSLFSITHVSAKQGCLTLSLFLITIFFIAHFSGKKKSKSDDSDADSELDEDDVDSLLESGDEDEMSDVDELMEDDDDDFEEVDDFDGLEDDFEIAPKKASAKKAPPAENPKLKKAKKMLATSADLFASAEEFSALIDENEADDATGHVEQVTDRLGYI